MTLLDTGHNEMDNVYIYISIQPETINRVMSHWSYTVLKTGAVGLLIGQKEAGSRLRSGFLLADLLILLTELLVVIHVA